MPEPLVVSLVALPAGVLSLVLLSRLLATRDLEAQIRVLEGQVVGWQSMHDHQVASMDRRLLDLEECAARAEEESRMVSLQMQRISQTLQHRVDQLNRQRSGRDAVPSGCGSAGSYATEFDREAALTAGGGW